MKSTVKNDRFALGQKNIQGINIWGWWIKKQVVEDRSGTKRVPRGLVDFCGGGKSKYFLGFGNNALWRESKVGSGM